ncbi:MAG: hypothetical protein PVJ86_12340 [Phycisphaerales bacterium]|jgi:hypothetical protein
MRLSTITIIVLFCILIVGCQENVEESRDRHLINSQLVNSYDDIAMQNAIASQHTLFPYHFVKNGPELNELGQRDLAALTTHFMRHAGHLNIRRHKTPADLYEARVKLVHDRLQEAGIDMERMSISDGMPGGPGMTSEKVLVILQEPSELDLAETSGGTSGSSAR